MVFGVNILGALDAESGVGEVARSIASSIQRLNIPFALNNAECHQIRREDNRFSHLFSKDNPYPVNLQIVYGHWLIDEMAAYGLKYFVDKYTVGCWVWELSNLPPTWKTYSSFVDETWVPSRFMADATKKIISKDVTIIPHIIQPRDFNVYQRHHFKIDDKKFVFLFIFNFYSCFERKNPMAVIEAFKKAFPENEDVLLVIKCSSPQLEPRKFMELYSKQKEGYIKIIKDFLSREEVNSLINVCDCYVSLHRSEGFGLPIAEAMYMGKPVIATNYSGNTDFMDKENSFLVDFSLVDVGNRYGLPGNRDQWADADIDHAAEMMRYVYENREKAKQVGMKAAQDIKRNLGPGAIDLIIKDRLEKIKGYIDKNGLSRTK
ncbi:glycosyltransferase family 4 protein [Candidatus Woesearchaeota archaeon]|nr:glycosyltransferase family 4 protein [Candidatus Woesearchaeota archaeon]